MNTFVFPFGFMTIMLQVVATILGLPIIGDKIPFPFYQRLSPLHFASYEENDYGFKDQTQCSFAIMVL